MQSMSYLIMDTYPYVVTVNLNIIRSIHARPIPLDHLDFVRVIRFSKRVEKVQFRGVDGDVINCTIFGQPGIQLYHSPSTCTQVA